MSTSTSHQPQETQTEEGAVVSTVGQSWPGRFIVLLVFVAGSASLAVEMAASRLLAPYFGTSLFVWANLIGLILLYLTLGYYLGGSLADRHPRLTYLCGLTTVASLFIGIIPLIAYPILNWALQLFANDPLEAFYGSLISVLLLFAVPMILLGCVSPYAIRLRVEQVGKSGRIAGQLYAISTIGSIVGTFLPVLVLMPDIGVDRTFISFAAGLLLVSLVGLWMARQDFSVFHFSQSASRLLEKDDGAGESVSHFSQPEGRLLEKDDGADEGRARPSPAPSSFSSGAKPREYGEREEN